MANRSKQWITASLLAVLATNPQALAQQASNEASAPSQTHLESTAIGMLTDRLSPKQLRAWESLRKLVFSCDKNGRLLHPRLHSLWQWAQSSGHAIYIELPDAGQSSKCEAGRFRMEKFDSQGRMHVASLRLNRSTIDRADVRKEFRRKDGLIPFQGLSRERRYAEVLGHELAHAASTLGEPKLAEACRELYLETERVLCRPNMASELRNPERRQRLMKIQLLMDEAEKPAEAAEREVWRELLAGQGTRAVLQ